MELLHSEWEKITIYDDKLVCKNTGKVFTLKGDVLKLFTDYKFNTTESPDAKPIIDFMDEMRFDTRARSKSVEDRNLNKNYFNKRALLASGLGVTFLSESPEF